eukprot:Ihof_evm3s125 gene=Ihof_evmTU3s125
MLRLLYFVVGLLPATVFCENATQPSEYTIGMKTLVLFDESQDQRVPRLLLDGYGTLYDIKKSIPDLTMPDYYAIVVSNPMLSESELTTLRNYAEKYRVRIAFLNSDLQLAGICTNSERHTFKHVVFDANEADLGLADVMNPNGYWNVSYPAQQAVTVDDYDHEKVTPFMRYTDNAHRESEGPVAAFIYTFPSGRQEMHFAFSATANELCNGCEGILKDQPNFVQTGDYTFLSLALGHVWFQWITRSIYFGERRIVAHVQVDDWFVNSDTYGEPNKVFRLNGTDVEHTVKFVQSLPEKLKLPSGSYIKYEPAFNGVGHTGLQLEETGYGIGLNEATNKHIGAFNWVSHTWSHQQLDWLNKNQCDGRKDVCHTGPERIRAEIKANRMIALGKYVNATQLCPKGLSKEVATPPGQMFYQKLDLYKKCFSFSGLVTPEISGLYPKNYNISKWNKLNGKPNPGNFKLMQTLWRMGIRSVVGDNSRPELVSNVSFHHAVITTVEEYGVAGIVIIPRIAINIAYNAHNEEQFLNWYNGVGASERYRQRTTRDMAKISATMTIKNDRPIVISVTSARECVAFLSFGNKVTYTPKMEEKNQFDVYGNDTTYHINLKGNGQPTHMLLTTQSNKMVSVVAPMVPTDRKSVSLSGEFSQPYDTRVTGAYVWDRPYVPSFLDFCFKNFDVAVWSSAKLKNVEKMVKYIFQDHESQLKFLWGQDLCTDTGRVHPNNKHKPIFNKDLSKIWRKAEYQGIYDQTNTLLIDDDRYKAELTPKNAIHPEAWDPSKEDDNDLGPDGKLTRLLTELLAEDDIQKFVAKAGMEGEVIATFQWGEYGDVKQ